MSRVSIDVKHVILHKKLMYTYYTVYNINLHTAMCEESGT